MSEVMEGENKTNSTALKIETKEAELYKRLDANDPSVTALKVAQEAFQHNYDNDLIGGVLGSNLQKLKEVREHLNEPGKANTADDMLKAVYKQADLGDYDIVVPEDTPADQQTAKGREVLQADIDALRDRLAKKYLEPAVKAEAEFQVIAQESGVKAIDAESRTKFRHEVSKIQDARIDASHAEVRAAGQMGGREKRAEVVRANKGRFKYEESPQAEPTPVEQGQHLQRTREQVMKGITSAPEEIKGAVHVANDEIEQIAAIEQKIENIDANLAGKDGKTGAIVGNPSEAYRLDNEKRKLDLEKKVVVGEVRIKVANERMNVAADKWKKFGEKLTGGRYAGKIKEGTGVLVEVISAGTNQLTENVRAQVTPQIEQLKDRIDEAKDDFAYQFEPIGGVIATAVDGVKGAVDLVQNARKELKENPNALTDATVKAIKESNAVKQIGKTLSGIEASRKASATELKKQVIDNLYAAEITYKDDLKRILEFKARMEFGALIGGEKAKSNKEKAYRRLELLRSTAEQKHARLESKLKANKKLEVFEQDLAKRIKKAPAAAPAETPSTPTPETPEVKRIFEDDTVLDSRILVQVDKDDNKQIWAMYRTADNSTYLQQVDDKGNRIGEAKPLKDKHDKSKFDSDELARSAMNESISKGRLVAHKKGFKEFDDRYRFYPHVGQEGGVLVWDVGDTGDDKNTMRTSAADVAPGAYLDPNSEGGRKVQAEVQRQETIAKNKEKMETMGFQRVVNVGITSPIDNTRTDEYIWMYWDKKDRKLHVQQVDSNGNPIPDTEEDTEDGRNEIDAVSMIEQRIRAITAARGGAGADIDHNLKFEPSNDRADFELKTVRPNEKYKFTQDKEYGPIVRNEEVLEKHYVTRIVQDGKPNRNILYWMSEDEEDNGKLYLYAQEVDDNGNPKTDAVPYGFDKKKFPADIQLRKMQQLNVEEQKKTPEAIILRGSFDVDADNKRVLKGLNYEEIPDPANPDFNHNQLILKDGNILDEMYLDLNTPLDTGPTDTKKSGPEKKTEDRALTWDEVTQSKAKAQSLESGDKDVYMAALNDWREQMRYFDIQVGVQLRKLDAGKLEGSAWYSAYEINDKKAKDLNKQIADAKVDIDKLKPLLDQYESTIKTKSNALAEMTSPGFKNKTSERAEQAREKSKQNEQVKTFADILKDFTALPNQEEKNKVIAEYSAEWRRLSQLAENETDEKNRLALYGEAAKKMTEITTLLENLT